MGERIGIGGSTGWLYALENYSLASHMEILTEAGASAAEVFLTGLGEEDIRFKSLLEGPSLSKADFLCYRSLHLPDLTDELNVRAVVARVKELMSRHGFGCALTHPLKEGGKYPEACYEAFVSAGVSLAIENMDASKPSGFSIRDLVYLTNTHGMSFVLDLQHAYERDPQMVYAKEMFYALKDRLIHFHVSGETEDSIHSLVCKASNRRGIMQFLADVFSQTKTKKPIILEGEYVNAIELREEINSITSELSL